MSVAECLEVYGLRLCVGDYVQVYIKSRSLVRVAGRVSEIKPTGLILETDNAWVTIRYTDIKMIVKPKNTV